MAHLYEDRRNWCEYTTNQFHTINMMQKIGEIST